MVGGAVNAKLESVVSLRVRGPGGANTVVNAIVDTGFTGSVTLPMSVITSLGLVKVTTRGVKLGDGVVRQVDTFSAEVEWDAEHRPVAVYATGREPLIGMRLLAGHQLRVDVVPGGAVEVTPLP